MSVWGKLGGGGLGLAVGGPLGGLIGAFAGHYLVDRPGAVFGPPPRDVILTTGLVALAAKMAKADGVVLQSEIEAFRSVVTIPDDEVANVFRLFRLAGETTQGFRSYAAQLARTFADTPALLDDILHGLFMIAAADGAIHEAERSYLHEVASIFGRDDAAFEAVLAGYAERPDDPYRVLGAEPGWDDGRIRRRYLALVAELHPDRAAGRGWPSEAIRITTSRLAAVNAAYDRIEGERRRSSVGSLA